jgi:hypothetical protein
MRRLKYQAKKIPNVTRGCGRSRVAGATYAVTDKEWFRQYPLSYFLFDPPILVKNPTAWGLSAQGISYVQKDGVWHAQDWIGAQFYPNAADILEEAVNLNGSGLFPLTNQLGQLTEKSKRLLFHPRGWIKDPAPFHENLLFKDLPDCPKKDDNHKINQHFMCAMLHWQDVTGGVDIDPTQRYVNRTIGQTTYQAAKVPLGVQPDFELALIGWLPIDEFQVVEGNDDKVAKALELLEKVSNIPFSLTTS